MLVSSRLAFVHDSNNKGSVTPVCRCSVIPQKPSRRRVKSHKYSIWDNTCDGTKQRKDPEPHHEALVFVLFPDGDESPGSPQDLARSTLENSPNGWCWSPYLLQGERLPRSLQYSPKDWMFSRSKTIIRVYLKVNLALHLPKAVLFLHSESAPQHEAQPRKWGYCCRSGILI